MSRRSMSEIVRVSIDQLIVEDEPSPEPRFEVAVVAARCGVRVAALRRYEEWGLVEPDRSGQRKLYSEADIERVQRIKRLVTDLGVNLAGVAAVLHLRQQVITLQTEMETLRAQLRRSQPY